MDCFLEIFSTLGTWCANLVSPQFWTHMLQTYKYAIVVAGALLEGEMVLILAGAAAYHNYMALPLVMLISLLGALLHDNLLFFIGRKWGTKILERESRWKGRISKVVKLIQKYDRYFIMSFRFIYGIRTLTPIVIGSSAISLKRYFVLVAISAAAWAMIVSYAGYSCAMALESIIANFEKIQKYLAAALVVIIGGLYLFFRSRKKGAKAPHKNSND